MSNKKVKFLVIILFLLFLAKAPVTKTLAQSEEKMLRVAETLSSEIPGKQVDSQDNIRANLKFKTDKTSETLRFVYPTSYVGKCYREKKYPGRCSTFGEAAALQRARSSIENFIGQVNKFGEQNYRLDTVYWGSYPVGFVKSAGKQYEYAWLESDSRFFSDKTGFDKEIKKFADRGFRIIEYKKLSRMCSYSSVYNTMESEQNQACSYVDAFLFEKEKSATDFPRQMLIRGDGGWSGTAGEKLTKQVNEKLSEGFFPVAAAPDFELLLEHSSEQAEFLAEKPELLVIESGKKKKINKLVKQGFRLELINDAMALMIRRKANTVPVSYVYLKTKNKNFAAEFAALTAKGAVYHTGIRNDYAGIETLVLEQSMEMPIRRREYKMLELDFTDVEKPVENRIETQLKLSAIESLKAVDELVKQGYKIREIFYLDKMTMLLER